MLSVRCSSSRKAKSSCMDASRKCASWLLSSGGNARFADSASSGSCAQDGRLWAEEIAAIQMTTHDAKSACLIISVSHVSNFQFFRAASNIVALKQCRIAYELPEASLGYFAFPD